MCEPESPDSTPEGSSVPGDLSSVAPAAASAEVLAERVAAADLFLLASVQSAWPEARDALTWRALAALRGDEDALEEYRAAKAAATTPAP